MLNDLLHHVIWHEVMLPIWPQISTDYSVLRQEREGICQCGVTPEEGETLVSSGKVDGATFEIAFINHPDLVKRVANGKPLTNAPKFEHLWGGSETDQRVGYTDYPEATYN